MSATDVVRTVGGTGNFYADYAGKKDKNWLPARAEAQAAWLAERRRDEGLQWFAATELHYENGGTKPLQKFLGSDWGITSAPGGNVLIYVKPEIEIMDPVKDEHLDRTFNLFHVRNPLYPTTPWWIGIEHYTSGTTKAIETMKRKQAAFGNKFYDRYWRAFRCGDYNSWQSSDDPTTPRGILRSAGWRSLQHTAEVYENRDLSTGQGFNHNNREIEDVFTREGKDGTSLVRIVKAKKWDVRPLTDHSAWFTFEAEIQPRSVPVPV